MSDEPEIKLRDRDHTDKRMDADVIPAYEAMKRELLAKLSENPSDDAGVSFSHIMSDGKKLTMKLILDKKRSEEQFEYYHYRYFHREPWNADDKKLPEMRKS